MFIDLSYFLISPAYHNIHIGLQKCQFFISTNMVVVEVVDLCGLSLMSLKVKVMSLTAEEMVEKMEEVEQEAWSSSNTEEARLKVVMYKRRV